MQDCRLLVELDAKLSIIRQKLIEHYVCCARLNDYTSHGRIDIFALRGAKRLCRRLPSKPKSADGYRGNVAETAVMDPGNKAIKKEADYQGGYVFEPTTGLHKNVYIFDFQSLYPSIIKTFNTSIDSYLGYVKPGPDVIMLPTGVGFRRNEIGIIPSIIQYVLDQRNEIRHKEMKKYPKDSFEYTNLHYKQYSFKVLANSMYGIMGASFSRYFKRELAEGITLTGQHIIKRMWDWLIERGMTPIYGDTDSLFVVSDIQIDIDQLVKDIKTYLDDYLVKTFNVKESHIIMDYKGMYPRFIAADKKKYVGITGEGEIEMTGLEAKKRDTLPTAEKWQRELLDMLLREEHDEAFFREWVFQKRKIITDGKLPIEEITFQKRMSKEVEDYGLTRTYTNSKGKQVERKTPVPPHIRVAAWLKERGTNDAKINLYSQGSYIPYIIIEHKKGVVAVHPDQFDGNYDIEYYWEASFSPSRRILEVVFPRVDWYKVGDGQLQLL